VVELPWFAVVVGQRLRTRTYVHYHLVVKQNDVFP